jgi:hypothetical protein
MSSEPIRDVSDPGRYQFSNILRCPRCGQTGVVTWEKSAHANSNGPAPHLIGTSEEFFERPARTPPDPTELVCQRCGTAQAE